MRSIFDITTQICIDLVKLIINGYRGYKKTTENTYIEAPYLTPQEEECIKKYGHIPNIPRSVFPSEE